MSRSKKIFLVFVVIFVILLGYASFDIGSRTTFPGSKPQLRERLEEKYVPKDTLVVDTLK
jgi:hypothetical protein